MITFIHKCSIKNVIYMFQRFKNTVDYSKVPVILETDLKEQFVRGSGPGGQKTNKTANCVVLKHIPTGLVVKCHESRLLQENQKIARALLEKKLDNLINGTESVDAQKQLLEEKKSLTNQSKKQKLRNLKEKWKQEHEKAED